MKNIKVTLNSFTPSKTVIESVGMPYDIDNPTIDVVNRVIGKFKHESVSEHAVFNFRIDGISRLCLQEVVRHRLSSFTVKSTRYALHKLIKEFGIDANNPWDFYQKISNNFVIPSKPENVSDNDYNLFISELIHHNTNSLSLMFKAKELGFKPDMYKYFVTENLRVKLSWTINFRSLINFLSLRLSKSAHFEIRHLAGLIKSEVCRIPYVRELLRLIDNRVTVDGIEQYLQTELMYCNDNDVHAIRGVLDFIAKGE